MHTKLVLILSAIAATTTFALAQPRHEQRRAPVTRTTGTIARPRPTQPVNPRTNPRHEHVYTNARTGREERHAIVQDHRPPAVIERDRNVHAHTRDYRSHNEWRHFHPAGGWSAYWGIAEWSRVGAVTCEAADENSGALYPVTAARTGNVWNDASIDAVLDQALDECAAEAGPQVCVAATPPCTFTSY